MLGVRFIARTSHHASQENSFLYGAVARPWLAATPSAAASVKKQDVFDRLDPQTQDKIRHGLISIGYPPDMVYIALGPPSEKQQKVTPEGDETTWIYKSYDRK